MILFCGGKFIGLLLDWFGVWGWFGLLGWVGMVVGAGVVRVGRVDALTATVGHPPHNTHTRRPPSPLNNPPPTTQHPPLLTLIRRPQPVALRRVPQILGAHEIGVVLLDPANHELVGHQRDVPVRDALRRPDGGGAWLSFWFCWGGWVLGSGRGWYCVYIILYIHTLLQIYTSMKNTPWASRRTRVVGQDVEDPGLLGVPHRERLPRLGDDVVHLPVPLFGLRDRGCDLRGFWSVGACRGMI